MMLMILAALAQSAAPAPDPDTCNTYIGRTVQPSTIDTAILQLSKLPRIKSEYETSEHFTARQAAAWPEDHAPLIIATPLDRKYIHYDADKGTLSVGLYAIDNRTVDYGDVFGTGTPFDDEVAYGHYANYNIVISEHEVTTGSYLGRNGFGARGRVDKVTRVTKAIFERASTEVSADLFVADVDRNKTIVTLPMTPQQAQLLKPAMTAAVVISPRWPYLATGTKDWGAATLEAPEEVTQRISVVVATIHCGLLLDGARKVVAAVSAL